MAVKSSDQITIVDITDSYSVNLSASAFTIPGDKDGRPTAQSLTVTVQAYKGADVMASSAVTIGTISTPTGVTASKSGLTITLAIATTCTGGQVSIPVTLDGEIEFTKTVSISISKTGATGAKGDTGATGAAGDDAILVTITSDNGTIFKNATGSTTLTAHVFVGGVEKTISSAGVVDGGLGSIYWYKDGTKVTTASKTLTIAASAVSSKMVVTAQLEE